MYIDTYNHVCNTYILATTKTIPIDTQVENQKIQCIKNRLLKIKGVAQYCCEKQPDIGTTLLLQNLLQFAGYTTNLEVEVVDFKKLARIPELTLTELHEKILSLIQSISTEELNKSDIILQYQLIYKKSMDIERSIDKNSMGRAFCLTQRQYQENVLKEKQELKSCQNKNKKIALLKNVTSSLNSACYCKPSVRENLLPQQLRYHKPLLNAANIENDAEILLQCEKIITSCLYTKHIEFNEGKYVFTFEPTRVPDEISQYYYLKKEPLSTDNLENIAYQLAAVGVDLSSVKKQYAILKKFLVQVVRQAKKNLERFNDREKNFNFDALCSYSTAHKKILDLGFIFRNGLLQRIQYIQSLFKAVENKEVKKVHIILHIQPDLPLGLQNNKGETLLHIAMHKKDKEMIKALLSYSTQHIDSVIGSTLERHKGSLEMLEFFIQIAIELSKEVSTVQ